MCTNGSRSAISMPAKARRTGKPSPSRPRGAGVIDFTRRGRSVVVGAIALASSSGLSTEMAGIGPYYGRTSQSGQVDTVRLRPPNALATSLDVGGGRSPNLVREARELLLNLGPPGDSLVGQGSAQWFGELVEVHLVGGFGYRGEKAHPQREQYQRSNHAAELRALLLIESGNERDNRLKFA